MYVRLYSWKATDVAFDDLEQVHKELDKCEYERWLRLEPNGEIDWDATRADLTDFSKWDFDEVARILARHLVAGEIIIGVADEYDEYGGWLVRPGDVVYLTGKITVKFFTPTGEVVAVETEE